MITVIIKNMLQEGDGPPLPSFHAVSAVRSMRSQYNKVSAVLVTLSSWYSLDSVTTSNSNIHKTYEVSEEIYSTWGLDSIYEDATLYLLSLPEFVDATTEVIIASELVSLDRLREQMWIKVKSWRRNEIDTDLITPYGAFQCNSEERKNITDAVLLSSTLASIGNPTTISFTLADNSVVSLDTTAMITVGLLLGQKVQNAHARARVLRSRIYDEDATEESILAISWVEPPVEEPPVEEPPVEEPPVEEPPP